MSIWQLSGSSNDAGFWLRSVAIMLVSYALLISLAACEADRPHLANPCSEIRFSVNGSYSFFEPIEVTQNGRIGCSRRYIAIEGVLLRVDGLMHLDFETQVVAGQLYSITCRGVIVGASPECYRKLSREVKSRLVSLWINPGHETIGFEDYPPSKPPITVWTQKLSSGKQVLPWLPVDVTALRVYTSDKDTLSETVPLRIIDGVKLLWISSVTQDASVDWSGLGDLTMLQWLLLENVRFDALSTLTVFDALRGLSVVGSKGSIPYDSLPVGLEVLRWIDGDIDDFHGLSRLPHLRCLSLVGSPVLQLHADSHSGCRKIDLSDTLVSESQIRELRATMPRCVIVTGPRQVDLDRLFENCNAVRVFRQEVVQIRDSREVSRVLKDAGPGFSVPVDPLRRLFLIKESDSTQSRACTCLGNHLVMKFYSDGVELGAIELHGYGLIYVRSFGWRRLAALRRSSQQLLRRQLESLGLSADHR